MSILLTVLAIVLIVFGVIRLIQGLYLHGILLILCGLFLGPVVYSIA